MSSSEISSLEVIDCDEEYFCTVRARYHTNYVIWIGDSTTYDQNMGYVFYYDKESKHVKYIGFIDHDYIHYVHLYK